MLGTPFVVIWLVGFIADLNIDSWLIKGLMYAGVWVAVQFLSKYVSDMSRELCVAPSRFWFLSSLVRWNCLNLAVCHHMLSISIIFRYVILKHILAL